MIVRPALRRSVVLVEREALSFVDEEVARRVRE